MRLTKRKTASVFQRYNIELHSVCVAVRYVHTFASIAANTRVQVIIESIELHE